MDVLNNVTQDYFSKLSDWKVVLKLLIKAFVSGLAIAFATLVIPSRSLRWPEVMALALTSGAVFTVLDLFFGQTAEYARVGSMLAVGSNLVGLKTM